MSYTAEDIDSIVEDYDGPWGGNWYEFIGQAGKASVGVELPGIGHVTAVERDVRQNDEYFAILKVTDADGNERLFRRSGWYASHYGGEYDGPTFEVRPVEKLITVYNKIA